MLIRERYPPPDRPSREAGLVQAWGSLCPASASDGDQTEAFLLDDKERESQDSDSG
jgi:hypothetical protein